MVEDTYWQSLKKKGYVKYHREAQHLKWAFTNKRILFKNCEEIC